MKILVIQLSRFGDLLQTTPMLRALRHRYPRASITVLCRYNVIEIYKNNLDVDYLELFNIEEFSKRLVENPENLFNSYLELKNAVSRLKSMRFDLVINATHDRFNAFLTYLLEAPESKGMILTPKKNRLQLLVNGLWFRYLRCTSEFRKTASFNLADIYKNAVGGDINARNLFFHTPADSLVEAEHLLNQHDIDNRRNYYIGFQLGTSTGNRRWPLEYFAALGNMLHRDKAIQVVLLGSGDEKGMGKKVASLMEVKPIDLIGKTCLSVLAAILQKCALLVTNDTGTMHLAEAVGTRSVALFFESANPFQTGPYGAGHIILFPDLDCFPCPTTFKCDEKRCLDAITVDTVCQLIRHKLNKNTAQTIHPPEGVRIYETRFSKTGTWAAWPLDSTKLDKNELIRMAYRSVWLKYDRQTGEGVFEERDGELETILTEEFKEWARCYSIEKQSVEEWLEESGTGLDIMEENIDKGLSLLEEISTSITSAPFNEAAVTTKSNEIGLLDHQIIQLGKSNPWLSQLTNLFELELEQIQDNNFFIMLKAWQQTYNALRLRVNLLREEIRTARQIIDDAWVLMDQIPSISACMMVKNEEKHLPKCLSSIKEFVDEIVIVDTGSEDKTIEIARDYGARVFEHPWENHFSKHRNQSIGYATGDWIFIIDADEELSPGDGAKLKGFVQSCSDVDAFLITVESAMKGGGKSVHNSLRLFKNRMNIHYEGSVHNELVGAHTARYIPIRILHHGYNLNDDMSPPKNDRTVNLLLQDIEDNPEHPRPHHYLAISLMSENRYEAAIKEAETAIELSKRHGLLSDLYSGSYYVASTAYMRLGELDRARYWALEAQKYYPQHLDSLFNLSAIYFEKHDLPLFWRYINGYFDLLQQVEKSGERFGTMIFYTTGSKWLGHLYKGCALIEEGSREKGEKEFECALACCPDKAHYHHLLAGFYKQKNELLKSEEEFNKALREAPDRTEIVWDFARFYKEANDFEKEKKWLKKLLKLNPIDKNALFELGLVNLKRNEFEEAALLFERVIEIDGRHIAARVNLALCLRKLGRFEESIRHSLEVIKDHPSSLETLSNLAYSYYSLNDYDNAGQYFIKMTQADPDQVDAYVYLSLLFLFNQDIESCVVSCDRILRLLNLKRDIVLHSPAELGDRFHAIAQKMLAINKPHLSRLSLEIGQILTSS